MCYVSQHFLSSSFSFLFLFGKKSKKKILQALDEEMWAISIE
jgi:hypothetical protein